MKQVSNNEFKIAYKSDDNQKMMEFAVKPFIGILQRDELEYCKMIGLWNALVRYNPVRSKFTSYLKNRVKWECLYVLNRDNSEVFVSGVPEQSTKDDSFIELNDLVEHLDSTSQLLIKQRFTDSLTYKQIGIRNGYSHETARKKIKMAIEQMREM